MFQFINRVLDKNVSTETKIKIVQNLFSYISFKDQVHQTQYFKLKNVKNLVQIDGAGGFRADSQSLTSVVLTNRKRTAQILRAKTLRVRQR